MSPAARSILAFGAYLALLGLGLLVVPDALLALFGQPPSTEPWLRVVGVVVLILALYYLSAAASGTSAFYRWTTWGRPLAAAILVVLAAARLLPRFVLIFAAVDVAGALWTWLALRAERTRS